MDYDTLDYQVEDGLLRLTLNRPDQLNAFTVTMADELVDAYGRASGDDEVRVILVTGAGKAFCAGMDLSVEGNVFGLDESLADEHLGETSIVSADVPAVVDQIGKLYGFALG